MAMERPFSSPLDAFDDVQRFAAPWPEMLAWPMFGWSEGTVGVLRVDEYQEDGVLVVRAELPGIEPGRDLVLTASGGTLHIGVERHEDDAHPDRSYLRHELVHRHRLARDLELPDGAQGSDLRAAYDDGVLEIRLPLPVQGTSPPVTRIPVSKT